MILILESEGDAEDAAEYITKMDSIPTGGLQKRIGIHCTSPSIEAYLITLLADRNRQDDIEEYTYIDWEPIPEEDDGDHDGGGGESTSSSVD